YQEFRDTVDLLPNYTLTIRVRLDDRPLADGLTPGGATGRWLFHCHIFFHHMQGMISELVVTPANDGKEKPNVNVGGSWAYAPSGGTTTRHGTFSDPDGDIVTLTATLDTGTAFGTISFPAGVSAGNWSWTSPVTADGFYYVYITATDADGRKDQ